MINIINMILDHEAQAWASELNYYNFFLENSQLTPEEKNRYERFTFAIMAILREFKEIKGVFEAMKNEYEEITFYCNKGENGKLQFFTWLEIIVKGEEGMGYQKKPVTILFNPLIDTTGFEEGGILTLKNGDYTRPYLYEIIQENGYKKKPYIWIDKLAAFSKLPKFSRRRTR